jgi:hypothetical protein
MKHKKFKLSSVILLCLGITNAIAQDAVPAAGGDATGTSGSASYSVGQVVYTSVSSASGSVNQGVQQPYEILITGLNTNTDINLAMSIFPNPSTTFIKLNVGKQHLENLSYQLYDVQGKLLYEKKITEVESFVLMNEYNSGSYLLKVVENKTELKTFKIIKN